MTQTNPLTPEELEAIQGMPPDVAAGYLFAKRNSEAQRREDPMVKVRDIIDKVGKRAKNGDPVHDARVDEFNDVFIDELKRREP